MVPCVRLSDKHMRSICTPRLELSAHITVKGTQAFTILGAGLVGPIVALVKGNRDWQGIQESAFTCGRYGALASLAIGPLLSGAFMWSRSLDSIEDRCYRLRCNKNQVRVDQLTILGTLAGVGIAYQLGEVLEKGAVFGLAGGCLFGAALNHVIGMF